MLFSGNGGVHGGLALVISELFSNLNDAVKIKGSQDAGLGSWLTLAGLRAANTEFMWLWKLSSDQAQSGTLLPQLSRIAENLHD